jgi:hypothetical protein
MSISTFAARLAQDVLQLVHAVGGVHVDEDRPDLRRGVLGDHPLVVVGGPDGDALAALDAEHQQGLGGAVHHFVELPVGEAEVLVHADTASLSG